MTGRCLCGAVRFEVVSDFDRITACHCTSCKKLSGGAGTVNGRARTEAIRILEGAGQLRTYQPEEGSAKTFCSVCGSNVFGGGWPESEFTSVRLTTLEEQLQRKPDSHIFVRSVAPWEMLPDDDVPRHDIRA